jgi:hypothetical protein
MSESKRTNQTVATKFHSTTDTFQLVISIKSLFITLTRLDFGNLILKFVLQINDSINRRLCLDVG